MGWLARRWQTNLQFALAVKRQWLLSHAWIFMRPTTFSLNSLLLAVVAGVPGYAGIISTSFVNGRYTDGEATLQDLTGYVAAVADAPNLVNTFTLTLDWASWGEGTGTGTSPVATNTMDGGAGIDPTLVLTPGNLQISSDAFGHFSGVQWEWSDGTPTAAGNQQQGDDDADAGMRFIDPEPGGTGAVEFTFAADPAGGVRAATLLLRRDDPMTISAYQDTSTIVIVDAGEQNGLATVEFDGAEDLVIRVADLDPSTQGTILRGFAATLSAVESPYSVWAASHIVALDAAADATFGGNPDLDPFDNGLEWILGGDPLGFDSTADLLAPQGYADTGLILSFTRDDDSETEAILDIEFSNDLFDVDFDFSTVPPASGTFDDVIYAIEENGGAPDEVTATIPASKASPDGKLFGRVNAIK